MSTLARRAAQAHPPTEVEKLAARRLRERAAMIAETSRPVRAAEPPLERRETACAVPPAPTRPLNPARGFLGTLAADWLMGGIW